MNKSCWDVTSCSIETKQVGLVELVRFFTCSTGNQPFSVVFFNPVGVKTMGIDRYDNCGHVSVAQCQQYSLQNKEDLKTPKGFRNPNIPT